MAKSKKPINSIINNGIGAKKSSLGMLWQLEQRMMFDGAAISTASEVIDSTLLTQYESGITRNSLTEISFVETNGQLITTNLSVQTDSRNPLFQNSSLEEWLADYTVPTGPINEIAFVDTRVEGYEKILAGIDSNVQVVLLDQHRDGVEQIATYLSQQPPMDSIHIISHGGSGSLQLGTGTLTQDSMTGQYADELATIQQALSEQADILVYGCNFAEGDVGQEAVTLLSQLTGADVAASTNLTGNVMFGGDWDLEVKTGSIETKVAVTEETQMNWIGVLAETWMDAATGTVIGGPVGDDWYVGDSTNNTPIAAGGGADIMYGAGGDDTLQGGSGNDILVGDTGNDTIYGDSDDDVILGGAGNDYLDGGSSVGKNTIIGGGGNDQMVGGSGADVFRFTGAQSGDAYTVDGGGATDIIDLSEFSTAAITNSGGVITVDRGGGNVFTINHSNVETVITAATVGNHGPLAEAGSDQTVATSATVTLTAAGSSDQDGNALTYQWTQIEGTKVTLSSSTAAAPTFTAPSSDTTLQFVVVVSDGTTSHADTVAITVSGSPVNVVPSSQTTAEDTSLVFSSGNGNQISISDPDAGGATSEVTISVTNGTLTLAGTTGLTFVSGDGTADTTITVRGTVADINNALNGASFTPTSNYNGGATLSMTTTDSTLVSLNLDANLQARYTFEGSANDVAFGTAENGTLFNGATYVTDGTRGQVLSLDGVDDYVQITGTFSNPSEVTIGGWVNLRSVSGRAEFISLDNRVLIGLDDSGLPYGVVGYVQVAPNTWVELPSSQFIAGTGWHHIMYTYSDSADTHSLYIDGARVATASIGSSIDWAGATNTSIGRNPIAGLYADAMYDDVRIYNRVLSASEVASLAHDQNLIDHDTVAMTVNAVNDAPSASGGVVSGVEDTPLVFTWAQFNVSDVDSSINANSAVRIQSLPALGSLQVLVDGDWKSVALNQIVTKATIDSGYLRYVPVANESGYPGYAAPGIGNQYNDYAQFNFSPVQTIPIAIDNPDAEADALSEGARQQSVATWTTNTAPPYIAGVENPTGAQFSADNDATFFVESGGTWLGKILYTAFDSANDYSLSLSVGWRSDLPASQYRVELWAGGYTLGFLDETQVAEVQGSLVQATLHVDGSGFASQDGQWIGLWMIGIDGQTNFDNLQFVSYNRSTDIGTTATMTIDITPANDAPVLADTALTLTVAEDAGAPSGAVGSLVSAFTGGITDADSGASKGLAITGTDETNGTWYYTTNGGSTWTAVGAVSNTSALLLADNGSTRLYFSPTANYTGTSSAALTVRAWDQTSGTAETKVSTASNGGTTAFSSGTDSVDVTVSPINDAPVLALGGTNLVVDGSFESGGTGWISNSVLEVSTNPSSYGISAPPDGTHFVEVEGSASSGTASYLEQTIATEVGRTYVYSLSAVTRNSTNIGDMGAVSVNGVEVGRFTTSSSWQDQAFVFTATSTSSLIRITSLGSTGGGIAPLPGDGGGLVVDNVRVVAVNDSVAYTEGGAPVTLAGAACVADQELSAANAFTGATLTLTRNGGANSQDVFSGSGPLSLSNGTVVVGGTTIGTYTNNGGTLVMTFNANATNTLVNSAMQQIAYSNSSDAPPSSVQINWTFSDGNSGNQGSGGALSATGSVTVSITAVNDAPTDIIFDMPITLNNGSTDGYIGVTQFNYGQPASTQLTFEMSFSATSIPSAELELISYALSSGNDNEINVWILPNGDLTFRLASGDAIPLGFNATSLIDGNQHQLSITWNGANGDTRFYADGIQVGSTTYKIGGSIPWATGAETSMLVFGQDQDVVGGGFDSTQIFTGNIFEVRLYNDVRTAAEIAANVNTYLPNPTADPNLLANWRMVNDGSGLISDLAGNHDLTLYNTAGFNSTFSVAENAPNGTRIASAVDVTDADISDSHTFSLTNDAGGRFAIDSSTGVITVANGSLLNYESATSHTVTVRATDSGGLTYDETITINLTNVNDAPTGADATIAINEDTSHTLTTANFGFSDVDAGDSLSAVRIDTLPSAGSLILSGVAVTAGQVITVADITAGNLVFTPAANANGTGYSSFTFSVRDSSNAYDPVPNTLTIDVTAVNDAPTFSVGDGQALTSFGSGWEFGKETVIQPDGKILVGGYSDSGGTDDFFLARYNADGTLDTSFGGGDGVVFAGIVGRAETMVLQADGKVVLSGYTTTGGYQVCLVRFNADGTLDTSFGGGDGVASSGVYGSAQDVALQTDGKFLVAADLSNSNFNLMRFNSDGSLDTSFGGGSGYVSTDLAGSNDRADSLTIQSDGKALLSGFGFNGTSFDFALVRYNTNGSLDTSFNGTGKVLTDFGADSSDMGNEVRMQADGKIVVAGWSDTGGTNDFAIARYNANGTLDTGFGTGGKVTINLGGSDLAEGLTIQADGKILVTGTAGVNGGDIGLVRLNTDGTLDTTFGGGDGIITSDYSGASDDRGYSVAVQANGEIVVSGATKVGALGEYNVALNRYSSNGSLDTTLDSVNTLNGMSTYTEGGSPVVLDADVQIFDAELSALNNFSGGALTLVRNGGANAEDVFSATGTFSLSSGNVVVSGTTIGTYTNSGGQLVLTFNSNATNALVNSVMQQIVYSNSSDAPPTSVQINWTFNDGNSGTQGTGGALQATGSVTVNITAVNDAPTITNLSGDSLTYSEGDGAVVIEQGANALVADVDSSSLDAGTLTISIPTGGDSAEDVLSIRNQGTGAGQIGVSGSNVTYEGVTIGTVTGGSNGNALVITLNGNTTPTVVTALVKNITYENTDTIAPTTGARTVRYVLTDGDGGISANYDTIVTVSGANDGPVNSVPGAQSVAEDTALTLSGISVTDVDGNLSSVQLAVGNGILNVTLAGGATISAGSNSTSTLTLSGNQADINATLATLIYQGTADFNGADTLTVTSTDSNAVTDVDTVAITVIAVNDVPLNTVPGEKTAAENGLLALNGISVNDVDGNLLSVQLQVTNGSLIVTLFGTASISNGMNGSNTLTLSGSQADINSTLSSLYYQANTGFSGLEKLTISSIDSNGAFDIDFIDISIPLPVPVPPLPLPLPLPLPPEPEPEPEPSPILVPPPVPEPMLPTIISAGPNLSPAIVPISASGMVGNAQLSTSLPQMVPSFDSTYFIDGQTSDTETSLSEPANHLGINRSISQSREVDSALINKSARYVTENKLSLQIITETALSSLPLSEIDYTQENKNYWIEVTQLDDESQKNLRDEELTLQIVTVAGLSMTALAASWLTRTGAFFIGLFSVFPTVKSIDPMAILDQSTNSDKQEAEVEEALLAKKLALYEEIFNKSNPKQ